MSFLRLIHRRSFHAFVPWIVAMGLSSAVHLVHHVDVKRPGACAEPQPTTDAGPGESDWTRTPTPAPLDAGESLVVCIEARRAGDGVELDDPVRRLLGCETSSHPGSPTPLGAGRPIR